MLPAETFDSLVAVANLSTAADVLGILRERGGWLGSISLSNMVGQRARGGAGGGIASMLGGARN